MSTHGTGPKIKIENALLGLSLTQTFFEDNPDNVDIFEEIISEYDDADLLAIYAQLATMWAITEANAAGLTPAEYMRRLRSRMIATDSGYKKFYHNHL